MYFISFWVSLGLYFCLTGIALLNFATYLCFFNLSLGLRSMDNLGGFFDCSLLALRVLGLLIFYLCFYLMVFLHVLELSHFVTLGQSVCQ